MIASFSFCSFFTIWSKKKMTKWNLSIRVCSNYCFYSLVFASFKTESFCVFSQILHHLYTPNFTNSTSNGLLWVTFLKSSHTFQPVHGIKFQFLEGSGIETNGDFLVSFSITIHIYTHVHMCNSKVQTYCAYIHEEHAFGEPPRVAEEFEVRLFSNLIFFHLSSGWYQQLHHRFNVRTE